MATARDRKAWSQILQLYHKDFPHLWDKTNSMYNNKNMRNDAYKVLTQIYKENFDLDASVDTLKKKLENMRTTYFRELKKVKESIQSGDDVVYEPTLWYFEQLNFLANLYEPNVRSSNERHQTTASDPLKIEDTSLDNSNSEQEYEPTTSHENTSKNNEYKKMKRKIEMLQKQGRVDPTKTSLMKNEDWEVMGRSIGLQLRDIKPEQLTIASKLISDTIYFARLNRLSVDSHVELGRPLDVNSVYGAQVGNL